MKKMLIVSASPRMNSNTAAAEDEEYVPQRAVSGLESWIECFEKARLAKSVFMGGVTAAGENPEHPALEQAYQTGKTI